MEKNVALMVYPETSYREIAKYAEIYPLVIRPSRRLDEKSVISSRDPDMIREMLDVGTYLVPDDPELPISMCSFVFENHHEAISFITDRCLVIGFESIDDISE